MSITIDYFFNHPKPLTDLAVELRQWIGCDLQPYEGDEEDPYCRLLGMEFSFGTHEFDDDRELDFSRFKYRIGLRTPLPHADFHPHQLFTMATLAYAMHRRLGVTGMLVFDVNLLLARYEQRPDPSSGVLALYDAVSDEQVVFPRHLMTLISRTPEHALSGDWEQPTIEYIKGIGLDVPNPEN